MAVLMLAEGLVFFFVKNYCTNVPVLIYRLLAFISLLAYLSIGQRIATLTVTLVEDRLIKANDSLSTSTTKFDKFSGVDLRFMINQIF